MRMAELRRRGGEGRRRMGFFLPPSLSQPLYVSFSFAVPFIFSLSASPFSIAFVEESSKRTIRILDPCLAKIDFCDVITL